MSIIHIYNIQTRLEPQQIDHGYDDAPSFKYLSGYKEAVVVNIAGFVVRMLKRAVSCKTCIDILL